MAKNSGIVTSAKLASLASKVLKGYEPTRDEVLAMAASVLRQRDADKVAKKSAKTTRADKTENDIASQQTTSEFAASEKAEAIYDAEEKAASAEEVKTYPVIEFVKEDVVVVIEDNIPQQQPSSWLGKFFRR